MSIVRWFPPLTARYDPWFPVSRFFTDFTELPNATFHHWPNMDVYTDEEDLLVKVELQEFKPEEVDVSLEDSHLFIAGTHEHDDEIEEENYYGRECYAGSFTRTVPLPPEVKEEDISANLKDGVLEVRVKGAATAVEGKRRIPIASS